MTTALYVMACISGLITLIVAVKFVMFEIDYNRKKGRCEKYEVFAVSPDGTETVFYTTSLFRARVERNMLSLKLKYGKWTNTTSLDDVFEFSIDNGPSCA